MTALVEHFCLRDDLSSYDPYDIWKTGFGFRVKKLYNRRPRLGLFPAAILAVSDDLVNHKLRLCYTPSEYPIVRAMAAMCLLNLYSGKRDAHLMERAERHLQWLVNNSCPGHSGYCWGLGFPHAAGSDVIYDRGTPFSTITPYALEAFIRSAPENRPCPVSYMRKAGGKSPASISAPGSTDSVAFLKRPTARRISLRSGFERSRRTCWTPLCPRNPSTLSPACL